ncbi:MAG: hypothetical protein R3Y63_14655 [Eubacteriales bacterium]
MSKKPVKFSIFVLICSMCCLGLTRMNQDGYIHSLAQEPDPSKHYESQEFLDWFGEEMSHTEPSARSEEDTEQNTFRGSVRIAHPVLTEEISFATLLQDVTNIVFAENTSDYTLEITDFPSEHFLFGEFMYLLDNAYLSPIDYELYPTGGGIYTEDNKFVPDINFFRGSIPLDTEITEKAQDVLVTFSIGDYETLEMEIFSNYNVILTHRTFDEEDDTIINYISSLPYRLTGEHRDVLHKINTFIGSDEYKGNSHTTIHTW